MQRSKLLSVVAAVLLAVTVGSSAYAGPSHSAAAAPAKPLKGTWNIVRSLYFAGHFTVRKHGASGFAITGFSGELKPAATGLYCPTVGKFTIPGTLVLKEIKASKTQKVWGYGTKFAGDRIVPENVTMKFKTGSVKAKLSMNFNAHQKVTVGQYDFNSNGGYLYEAADSDCGSVFSVKHK